MLCGREGAVGRAEGASRARQAVSRGGDSRGKSGGPWPTRRVRIQHDRCDIDKGVGGACSCPFRCDPL